MKVKFLIPVICISLAGAVASCKKAGTDGKTTVVVFLEHHGVNVKNHVTYPDTVYVKFNATEAAGSLSGYDTYFVGEVGEDHTHCLNLHTGKYYLFGVGYDSTINQRVTGGMALKIAHKDRDGEVDTHLAVSE